MRNTEARHNCWSLLSGIHIVVRRQWRIDSSPNITSTLESSVVDTLYAALSVVARFCLSFICPAYPRIVHSKQSYPAYLELRLSHSCAQIPARLRLWYTSRASLRSSEGTVCASPAAYRCKTCSRSSKHRKLAARQGGCADHL